MLAENGYMVGKSFGRWTILSSSNTPPGRGTRKYVICKCSCGIVATRELRKLTSGHSKSCGCFKVDKSKLTPLIHGCARRERNHKCTPEYECWQKIKSRCLRKSDKSYSRYGGRGIQIYPPWVSDFVLFYEHIGPKPTPNHSIDRINNEGNYEPVNVRWALREQQANNKRNNVRIVVNGHIVTIAEASRTTGISYGTLLSRVKRGWDASRAVGEPVDIRRGKKAAGRMGASLDSGPLFAKGD